MSSGAFVTIAEFMLPSDVVVARGRLESEGIECILQDELTVQVHNFYSQAVGGVKLQVREEEVELAKRLLAEWGLFGEGPAESSVFWDELDAITKRIPLIGKLDLLMARLMVLVTVVMLVIAVPLVYAAQPSKQELLVQGNWCVDRIMHDGVAMEPYTLGLTTVWDCAEKIHFDASGDVRMPGFGTTANHGEWTLNGGQLWLERMDTLNDVFRDPFRVSVSERELILESSRTVIMCSHVNQGF